MYSLISCGLCVAALILFLVFCREKSVEFYIGLAFIIIQLVVSIAFYIFSKQVVNLVADQRKLEVAIRLFELLKSLRPITYIGFLAFITWGHNSKSKIKTENS